MAAKRLLAVLAVAVLGAGHATWAKPSGSPAAGLDLCPGRTGCRHVYDMARALPPHDIPRFEQYMAWILRESDVDVRFAFVKDTGGVPIEQLATDLVERLRIGGRGREERGVLLLYDLKEKRLKVEVGYGLEGHLPDAFVSYLVNDHARQFLESGHLSVGLRLMLRLIQHRIREAVLGDDFDPRVLGVVSGKGHLSGGAGATAKVHPGAGTEAAFRRRLAEGERERLRPGATPAQTYATYLAWLSAPQFDPQVEFFTPPSRQYLAQFPISKAYRDFILFGEYGKAHRIVERGDLALLVFTGTPFVSPHFFVKEGGAWRMDLVAEVRNTVERVGGSYTWDWRGADDAFTRAFADLLADVKGYRRFREGDNRALVIRGRSPGEARSR